MASDTRPRCPAGGRSGSVSSVPEDGCAGLNPPVPPASRRDLVDTLANRPRGRASVKKTGDRVDDYLLLGAGELGVDRNGQALGGCTCGVREVPPTIANVPKTRLQGQRQRIVDLVADAGLVEMALERVASGRADDELIEDVPAVRRLGGQFPRPFASRRAEE